MTTGAPCWIKPNTRIFDRCDLPVPFFPVTMFSAPSNAVASMLSCVLSLVSPRLMGKAWLILIRLSRLVVERCFICDCVRLGNHVPPVVRCAFSRLARILHTSIRLSCMTVIWLAISSGS